MCNTLRVSRLTVEIVSRLARQRQALQVPDSADRSLTRDSANGFPHARVNMIAASLLLVRFAVSGVTRP